MRYNDILTADALKDPAHIHHDMLVHDVAEFFTEGIQSITVGVYLSREPGEVRERKVQQVLKEVKEKNPWAIGELCYVIDKMGVPCGHLFNDWLRKRNALEKYIKSVDPNQ